jgi:3-hydroxyacyl-[acyl-carrier-protein] dehydratase
MRKENNDSQIIKGSFLFNAEDAIYADHFPGNPVIPGSMIIHAFMLAADKMGAYHGACTISGFRFKKFIPPGEYAYQIEITGKDLKCSLFEDTAVVASGMLCL